MFRYALWSELLALDAVRQPATLTLLAKYQLELRIACFESTSVDELALTLRAARAHGVQTALWPMLDNDKGRWASAHNGEPFARFVRRLVAELSARQSPTDSVMIDIEPPIDVMERWVDRARTRFQKHTKNTGTRSVPLVEQRVEGDRAIAQLFDELSRENVRVGAAMVPTDLLATPLARSVEWLFGLPNGDVPYEPASAMLYTSMLEGYSRGWISRERALALLRRGARRALARFGPRAEVSLGVVSTGALGDEPVYRDPDELRQDVAIVRSFDIRNIALFELRGVLQRSEPERWLDALTK